MQRFGFQRLYTYGHGILLNLSHYFTVLRGFRMKLISHRRTESRTWRRPSSPGTVSTLPSRTSSRRRFASVIHSCSIRPRSSPSRLSTRRSASRARDSLGSVIACSANCSTVVAINTHSLVENRLFPAGYDQFTTSAVLLYCPFWVDISLAAAHLAV